MTILHTVILGIIEGLTEFLPISSTGHMILASSVMGISDVEFVKTFEIFIQLGAILAIVVLYAKKYITDFAIYQKVIAAFIPTAIVGFVLYKIIKAFLFGPLVVSVSLIIGGIILVAIDRFKLFQKKSDETIEKLSLKKASFIGLIQSLSVVPGVSRAAATIVGGMSQGLTRQQATEFSFLLAVPTMLAATTLDLIKTPIDFTQDQFGLLFIGSVTAFVTAWIAVKLFTQFVAKHGFSVFGYYRIVLGLIFLVYFFLR